MGQSGIEKDGRAMLQPCSSAMGQGTTVIRSGLE